MSEENIYEGMIIHHLEDFSNSGDVLHVDNYTPPPSNSTSSSTYQKAVTRLVSKSDQSGRSLLGDHVQLVYGIVGNGDFSSRSYDLGYRTIGNRPLCYIGDGKFNFKTMRVDAGTNSGLTYPYNPTKGPRVGIRLERPSNLLDRRVIFSFDYTPIDGDTTLTPSSMKIMTTFMDDSEPKGGRRIDPTEYIPFPNRNIAGKIEVVFENNTISVYFRNKPIVHKKIHVGNFLYFGQWHFFGTSESSLIVSSYPTDNTPFAISNLVMVSVPMDSLIKRLGNIRVERSLVSKVDNETHSPEDELNGTKTNDGKSLDVEHNINTIEFEPIELNGGENIIGSQMTISATNTPTGSHIETKAFNGEEELADKTHELNNTQLSREVVGDFILGDLPEDYENLKLKVRSVEV